MQYHKIQSLFKRNQNTHDFIIGEYTCEEFEYLKDNIWIFDEKIDGTNIRIYWDHLSKTIRFGGRTENANIPVKLYNELLTLFIKEKFELLYPETSMILYGEGFGEGIQKGGGNYLKGVSFILFDVFIDKYWLSKENVYDIADKLKIMRTSIVGNGTIDQAIDLCKKGFNSHFGNFIAEGLILRPAIELKGKHGERIITKLKYRDFNKT